MALTAQQTTDCRRWIGYPALADVPVSDNRDDVQVVKFNGTVQTLYHLLTNLSASEESVLVTVYLTPLATLESAITGAGDNLDTDSASVWTHNKNEVADRTSLFKQICRAMADFLGVPYGPGLGGGGNVGASQVELIRG